MRPKNLQLCFACNLDQVSAPSSSATLFTIVDPSETRVPCFCTAHLSARFNAFLLFTPMDASSLMISAEFLTSASAASQIFRQLSVHTRHCSHDLPRSVFAIWSSPLLPARFRYCGTLSWSTADTGNLCLFLKDGLRRTLDSAGSTATAAVGSPPSLAVAAPKILSSCVACMASSCSQNDKLRLPCETNVFLSPTLE